MKIVCISDSHNQHRKFRVPDGDLLIHAGDATGEGSFKEVAAFLCWLDGLPHRHKILVAGNHDFLFERHPDIATLLLQDHPRITYLQDSGCEVEGLRIWGSPWQPWFMDWAFNLPRGGQGLHEVWNKIPVETDVLVTHCPPHGVLDQVGQGEHLGCEELAIRLAKVKPRLHVFGHIHDGAGRIRRRGTTFVNASVCDEDYLPLNPAVVVRLKASEHRGRGPCEGQTT